MIERESSRRASNKVSSATRQAAGTLFLAAMLTGATLAADVAAPSTFTDGQKIEIREGDTWSAGTVVKKEGRKYLVHYEGGVASTDEWVTADRLRLAGAAPAVTGTSPGTTSGTTSGTTGGTATKPPATPPTEVKPKPVVWNISDKIDCKWGGLWKGGSVTNKNGKWYLVTYDDGFREWVEPWRLRKKGSTEDAIGYASPHKMMLPKRPVDAAPKEDPADAPAPPSTVASRSEQEKAAAAALEKFAPLTPSVRTGLYEVAIGGGGIPVTPDAAVKSTRPVSLQPVILVGGTGNFFEHIDSLLFTSASEVPTAVAIHVSSPPGEPVATRVERVDLAAGHDLGTVKMPVPVKGCDISSDGKQLLAHSTAFGFGQSDRLDLWNIAGTEPAQVISFKPYDDLQHAARDVEWAKFIDAEHVVTLNRDGRLIVWDVKGKALWATKITPNTTPALSATGKYLAVAAGDSVAILAPLTGKTLRMLEGGSLNGSTLSFKPDGTQVAAIAQDMLLIWDLSSGELKYDLSPLNARGHSIHWAGDGYVLLDGTHLIGLEQKVVLWKYDRQHRGQSEDIASFGGRFFYTEQGVGDGSKATLASIVLPDEKTKAALAQLKIDDLMIIKPGVKVSLEVNLPENIQAQVLAALKAHLQANGVTVEDGQPLRLVATTEPGKTREMSYGNMMGPRFGPMAPEPTKISVNELISRLSFIGEDGKPLWERQSITVPPSFLSLKKDQSIDQAVADAMVPRANFFEHTRIPKFVPKPAQSINSSRLTAHGTVVEH